MEHVASVFLTKAKRGGAIPVIVVFHNAETPDLAMVISS